MAVRIRINPRGVRKILRSREVQNDLDKRAKAIARQAGDGFMASSMKGRNRARASVITDSYDARKAEADDRALTRSIDAGR